MADYGLKISQDGYSITTSDPRNLVFSSGFNTLGIALQGSSNQTGTSGDVKTFTIAHGLSFTPYVMVFFNTSKYSSYWKSLPNAIGTTSDFLGNKDVSFYSDIRVDSTNLVVRITLNNGASDTVTIKYYIFNVSV